MTISIRVSVCALLLSVACVLPNVTSSAGESRPSEMRVDVPVGQTADVSETAEPSVNADAGRVDGGALPGPRDAAAAAGSSAEAMAPGAEPAVGGMSAPVASSTNCTDGATAGVKAGFCFVSNSCFRDGETAPRYDCQYCDAAKTQTTVRARCVQQHRPTSLDGIDGHRRARQRVDIQRVFRGAREARQERYERGVVRTSPLTSQRMSS